MAKISAVGGCKCLDKRWGDVRCRDERQWKAEMTDAGMRDERYRDNRHRGNTR